MAGVVGATVFAIAASTGLYFVFLGLLTVPWFQNQAIYLHNVKLTWGKDVNLPEQWGFLHNQITPFNLKTPDGETLHAWHILPLEVYRRHEKGLLEEPSGQIFDIEKRRSFDILKHDPNALLVVYLHGAAGTLGSGHRPQSYRAISAMAPDRIHIMSVDYRGFGTSTGSPSEQGLVTDALTLADWAMNTAGIPPEKIVIFSQSLGTAVAISLMRQLASRPEPIYLRGLVMVAPFSDVKTLTATYKVAGTIPILSPLARFPVLMDFFARFIETKFPSKDTLAEFVRHCQASASSKAQYHVTAIHAKDDYDIPWSHSEELYWTAVNAAENITRNEVELDEIKHNDRKSLGAGGWVVEKDYTKGTLRQHILDHGLHDWTMGYPAVSMAIWKAFLSAKAIALDS
ncbi:Alpha/Beta hydrolase protein [Elsinoe ampelina]|uniref:Alpha/Beta hydrolase protein n=1 Tax=Elsinoe ampelina TaxID=302913 RepID=A0A6A6G909_9PEZI|nr:Alpha/Beta hydrolase protein [Elsinoe ampelina]